MHWAKDRVTEKVSAYLTQTNIVTSLCTFEFLAALTFVEGLSQL